MNMRWNPAQFAPPRADSRPAPAVFWLTGIVLTASLVIGGASRENAWQVAIIEILSLPLLGAAILRLVKSGGTRGMVLPTLVLAMVILIPLVQLIPLPFDVWMNLPGRQVAGEALRLAGLDSGWRPISLKPEQTLSDSLALIPPAAVFLGALSLGPHERRGLTLIVPLIAIVSLLVGGAQVASGEYSRLYFYEDTNPGSGVGLFANRNHQAALLVTVLPLVALWIDLRGRDPRRRLIPAAIALSVLLLVILGLVIVKSRAGVLLLIPSLLASLALVWRGEAGAHRQTLVAMGGVVVAAMFIAAVFALGPVLERFGGDEIEGRLQTAPIVLEAATANLPVGSGIGSFVPVFAAREPIETMGPSFWNHAHNDYLEVWLEAGVMAAIALAVFIFWWFRSAASAWTAPLSSSASLARAGSIVTLLLLIHSTVDYPLRTLALATLFAFACALMVMGEPQPQRVRRRVPLASPAEPGSSAAVPSGPATLPG